MLDSAAILPALHDPSGAKGCSLAVVDRHPLRDYSLYYGPLWHHCDLGGSVPCKGLHISLRTMHTETIRSCKSF